MPEEKFVAGVDPGLKEWVKMRNSLREARASGKSYETIAGSIKYRSLKFWHEEIEKMHKISSIFESTLDPDESQKPTMDSFKEILSSRSHEFSMQKSIDANHLRYLIEVVNEGLNLDLPLTKALRTMLHITSQRSDYYKVEMLLEYGADVNCRDRHQETPLHLATKIPLQLQPERIINILLDFGADIDAASATGFTPLHQACLNGVPKIIELLLMNGANVYCLDKKGFLPIHYGQRNAELVFNLFRRNVDGCGKHQHERMWAHIMSRQIVSSVFMLVEPSCVKCRRKYKECNALKKNNYRYWLFAHEKDMS